MRTFGSIVRCLRAVEHGWVVATNLNTTVFFMENSIYAVSHSDLRTFGWCSVYPSCLSKKDVLNIRVVHSMGCLVSTNSDTLTFWKQHLFDPINEIHLCQQTDMDSTQIIKMGEYYSLCPKLLVALIFLDTLILLLCT